LFATELSGGGEWRRDETPPAAIFQPAITITSCHLFFDNSNQAPQIPFNWERITVLIVHSALQRFLDCPDFVHAIRSASMPAVHLKTRSSTSLAGKVRTIAQAHPYAVAAAATVGALAMSALINRHRAKNAENDNPPPGQFLEVNGVRLHYVERGSGEPLVLLHGNGSMIQDFESSDLIDLAANSYRVIVFDRPGFGHSDRPRNVVWTAAAQAELINSALNRLGVSHAIVLGHSSGASVAVALALKYPKLVQGLVLASGYYYPTLLADVVAFSAPAVRLGGVVLSHTLSPVISRVMWPLLMAKIFGPRSVPK
jgi:hypothetical protein